MSLSLNSLWIFFLIKRLKLKIKIENIFFIKQDYKCLASGIRITKLPSSTQILPL